MTDKLEKIVMIGPVYPYKGGISHYTGLMNQALTKKYDVTMVSFRFQYPKILFKKEQKDFSNDSFRIKDTKYWIHTANPLNWFRVAKKIRDEQPNFIILQWWHFYFAPCYWFLGLLLRKYRILFVCHNVFPHERFPLDEFLTKMVLKRGNSFIVQSGSDAKHLIQMIPNANYRQTVHPTYNAFQFNHVLQQEARKILHIDSRQKVLLFFGYVREYKGLKYLIQALNKVIPLLSEIKLIIAGDFGNDKVSYIELIRQEKIESYILIYDYYVPDQDIEKFFAASDLVILPYESATQSGIAQMAYGFEKPVIATNVGGLPDVVVNGKTGYIVEAKNSNQIAEAIVKFYKEGKEKDFLKNIREEAYRFSWDRLIETVENLMG